MTPSLSELRGLLAAYREAEDADRSLRMGGGLERYHLRVTMTKARVALEDAMHSALPDILDRLERAEKLLLDAKVHCFGACPGPKAPELGTMHKEGDCDDCDLVRQIGAFLSEGSKP